MWAPIYCYLFICSTSFCFFICLDLGVSPGNKNSSDYLPALRSISTHLCFFCLCFSLSSKSSTPESPKTPSSPWDLEWMLSQLTRLFPTSHKRTGKQPSKELFGELCCSRFILTVKRFATLHKDTKSKMAAAVFSWANIQCSLKEVLDDEGRQRKLHGCQWRCLWLRMISFIWIVKPNENTRRAKY